MDNNKHIIEYHVEVTANASKNEVITLASNKLKIAVSAPPIQGKANKALLSLLSEHFGVPKSRILFLSGTRGKHKKIGVVHD